MNGCRHFPLQESAKTCERQSKAAKNAEHESSVRSWEKQIKAEKDQINNIKQNEVYDTCRENVNNQYIAQVSTIF